jgi:pimeloyl-ACP methyl ester carboxylesterase
MRGLLDPAPQPNGKLLMVFPGWPGIPRIEVKDGRPSFLYLQQHVQELKPLLHQAGISLMTVDCPTDQWGARGANPTACDDSYRSSPLHAQDVRALIERTRQTLPMKEIYVMGHSYGAVSSHWLAVHLGGELAGSVHLTELDISGLGLPRRHRLFAPHLSDEGLARALGGTRVRKLGLSGCDKLTGSFLGALTSLEDLNVSFCSKITGSALLPLAARLKHCEMKYSGVSAAEFHAFSLAAAAAAAAAPGRPPAVAG